jgi:hypothetical protein
MAKRKASKVPCSKCGRMTLYGKRDASKALCFRCWCTKEYGHPLNVTATKVVVNGVERIQLNIDSIEKV